MCVRISRSPAPGTSTDVRGLESSPDERLFDRLRGMDDRGAAAIRSSVPVDAGRDARSIAAFAKSSVPSGAKSATASSSRSTTDSSVARWPSSSLRSAASRARDLLERRAEIGKLACPAAGPRSRRARRGRGAPGRSGSRGSDAATICASSIATRLAPMSTAIVVSSGAVSCLLELAANQQRRHADANRAEVRRAREVCIDEHERLAESRTSYRRWCRSRGAARPALRIEQASRGCRPVRCGWPIRVESRVRDDLARRIDDRRVQARSRSTRARLEDRLQPGRSAAAAPDRRAPVSDRPPRGTTVNARW